MLGARLASATGYPISAAHLHNALPLRNFISKSDFPDLRLLSNLQREENIFVGQAPRLPSNSLINGQSPVEVVQSLSGLQIDGSGGHRTSQFTTAEKLGLGTPVSSAFHNRSCLGHRRADLTADDTEIIVNAGKRNNQTRSRGRQVSLVGLLSLLGEAIGNETVHLSIDYSLLNDQCWCIQNQIHDDIKEIVEEETSFRHCRDSYRIFFVPGMIS